MLDVSNTSLIVNVIALFLLIIGVVGRKGSKKVLIRHGYLSVLAFALKMATFFAVMLPTVLELPGEIDELSVLQSSVIAAKIVLGIVGTGMSLICIVPWFLRPRGEMACLKVKRWMTPTFIVWVLSVLLGAVVDLAGIV